MHMFTAWSEFEWRKKKCFFIIPWLCPQFIIIRDRRSTRQSGWNDRVSLECAITPNASLIRRSKDRKPTKVEKDRLARGQPSDPACLSDYRLSLTTQRPRFSLVSRRSETEAIETETRTLQTQERNCIVRKISSRSPDIAYKIVT